MKKEWQAPDLEILIFSIQDVISESPVDPNAIEPSKDDFDTDWT